MKSRLIFLLLPILMTIPETLIAQGQVEDIKNLSYNGMGFVSQERKVLSNGDELLTRYRYVVDFNTAFCVTNNDALGYYLLKQRNIIDKPVETYTILRRVGQPDVVTAGEFYTFHGAKPYPSAKYVLRTNTPIQSFQPMHVNTSNCQVVYANSYELVEYYQEYNDYGNLLQKNVKGRDYTFLYGYNGQYKVAEVVNATLGEVAYTSFEGTGHHNWNYSGGGMSIGGVPTGTSGAVTGYSFYDLGIGTDITTNTLAAGEYVISFWKKDGTVTINNATIISGISDSKAGGWSYWEYVIDVSAGTPVTITGSGKIDELRLYPKDAMMETYTYQSSVGVSSKCDHRNNINYYEYDQLGRIYTVRNRDGNIIKKYDYKLQQPE